MTKKSIALVGLSGVGKSWLISSIQEKTQFQALSASQLIKEQKLAYTEHDELRHHDINDNQRLLIDGFKRVKRNEQIPTVLDGHTVIETPNGLIKISANVFREIGIGHFVFLMGDPEVILKQRANDSSRNRSAASLDELVKYQKCAIEVTTDIALEMRTPLTIITTDNVSTLESILKSN